MSYYTDLARELRKRKCTETQVVDALETVKEGAVASGREPEEEFGTPAIYALQYEGPRSASPGQRLLVPFGIAGLLCVLIYAIWPGWFSIEVPVLRQFAGVIALAVLVLLGAVIGSIIDNRLPSGFTPPAQGAE
ncbi:MAG: hypothetical protein L0G99_14585 [Propionibacteriales bacterium]|nr:hypothetical protein [Propionibacteriales bacterium]